MPKVKEKMKVLRDNKMKSMAQLQTYIQDVSPSGVQSAPNTVSMGNPYSDQGGQVYKKSNVVRIKKAPITFTEKEQRDLQPGNVGINQDPVMNIHPKDYTDKIPEYFPDKTVVSAELALDERLQDGPAELDIQLSSEVADEIKKRSEKDSEEEIKKAKLALARMINMGKFPGFNTSREQNTQVNPSETVSPGITSTLVQNSGENLGQASTLTDTYSGGTGLENNYVGKYPTLPDDQAPLKPTVEAGETSKEEYVDDYRSYGGAIYDIFGHLIGKKHTPKSKKGGELRGPPETEVKEDEEKKKNLEKMRRAQRMRDEL